MLTVLGAQAPAGSDDAAIAASLAQMLRAARSVVSANQALINDPDKGDKGLTGKFVLAEALKAYPEAASIDPSSRQGRLLHAQMDASLGPA